MYVCVCVCVYIYIYIKQWSRMDYFCTMNLFGIRLFFLPHDLTKNVKRTIRLQQQLNNLINIFKKYIKDREIT